VGGGGGGGGEFGWSFGFSPTFARRLFAGDAPVEKPSKPSNSFVSCATVVVSLAPSDAESPDGKTFQPKHGRVNVFDMRVNTNGARLLLNCLGRRLR